MKGETPMTTANLAATNASTDNVAKPECRVIRTEESYRGQQGLNYFAGISAETVGARHLCMHLVKLPPGIRAKAHLHAEHETAVYVIRGDIDLLHGDKLEQHVVIHAGEFAYIPAGVPHLPFNTGEIEAVAVL